MAFGGKTTTLFLANCGGKAPGTLINGRKPVGQPHRHLVLCGMSEGRSDDNDDGASRKR